MKHRVEVRFRATRERNRPCLLEEILSVEMEAAALYTFATARDHPVICFAHVTNQMGQTTDDFEKGAAEGARDTLEVVDAAVRAWAATK